MADTSTTTATDPSPIDSAAAAALIQQYYAAFNERRFVDAAACFADNAVLDQLPVQRQEPGGVGYLQFVSAWVRAFPDASFAVRRIVSNETGTFDVMLDVAGTHRGALDIGGWVFRPTGSHVSFGIRELIEVRGGRIAFSSVIYDLHEIVEKLAHVDVAKLLSHIDRLRHLAESLHGVKAESVDARDIAQEIGRELDAARHVVRPYYKRNGSGAGSWGHQPDGPAKPPRR